MTPHGIWCPKGEQLHHCLIDPLKLAVVLANRHGDGGSLDRVHVFRDQPISRHDRVAAIRSDRQAATWVKDDRVTVQRRPLRYPKNYGAPDCTERPSEKGIDVSLAIALVAAAIRGEFDVAIVVSHDTDLIPALNLAAEQGHRIEVAAWGTTHRLNAPGIAACHQLSEAEFRSVRDHTDYSDTSGRAARRDLIDPADATRPKQAGELSN
jgi:uncharacterized LabA/DUF88 family protein